MKRFSLFLCLSRRIKIWVHDRPDTGRTTKRLVVHFHRCKIFSSAPSAFANLTSSISAFYQLFALDARPECDQKKWPEVCVAKKRAADWSNKHRRFRLQLELQNSVLLLNLFRNRQPSTSLTSPKGLVVRGVASNHQPKHWTLPLNLKWSRHNYAFLLTSTTSSGWPADSRSILSDFNHFAEIILRSLQRKEHFRRQFFRWNFNHGI